MARVPQKLKKKPTKAIARGTYAGLIAYCIVETVTPYLHLSADVQTALVPLVALIVAHFTDEDIQFTPDFDV